MEKIDPGLYQFTLPYLPYPRHRNDDGYHETRTVSVEIHVGRKEDLQEGKWMTTIAYSTSGFSDYVETVFSNIRKFFLKEILRPYPVTDRLFFEEGVRLVEVHTKSQNVHDWHELEMAWDHRRQMYLHPIWKAVSCEAWFFQAYQTKMQIFAQLGLECLSTMKETHLLTQTPLWLIRVLQETESFIQEERLETDALSLIINSLKRLAGERVEPSLYSCEVTALLIEEFNQLKSPDVYRHYTGIAEEAQQALSR